MTENKFNCLPNCGECCGVVPIDENIYSKYLFRKQREVKNAILLSSGEMLPVTEDNYCVFLNKDKKCEIYDDRPQLCRDYGARKLMPCPFLYPNGVPRSEKSKSKAFKLHYANLNKLHEFVTNENIKQVN